MNNNQSNESFSFKESNGKQILTVAKKYEFLKTSIYQKFKDSLVKQNQQS